MSVADTEHDIRYENHDLIDHAWYSIISDPGSLPKGTSLDAASLLEQTLRDQSIQELTTLTRRILHDIRCGNHHSQARSPLSYYIYISPEHENKLLASRMTGYHNCWNAETHLSIYPYLGRSKKLSTLVGPSRCRHILLASSSVAPGHHPGRSHSHARHDSPRRTLVWKDVTIWSRGRRPTGRGNNFPTPDTSSADQRNYVTDYTAKKPSTQAAQSDSKRRGV